MFFNRWIFVLATRCINPDLSALCYSHMKIRSLKEYRWIFLDWFYFKWLPIQLACIQRLTSNKSLKSHNFSLISLSIKMTKTNANHNEPPRLRICVVERRANEKKKRQQNHDVSNDNKNKKKNNTKIVIKTC